MNLKKWFICHMAETKSRGIRLIDKKEKNRKYMRKYNASEKGKAYNKKHVKEWRKKTKKSHSPNRKSISAGYRDIIVDFLIKRDGLVCGICKQSLEGSVFHINHKIPVALGGTDTMDNVDLTHPKCNIAQAIEIRKQKHGY